MTPSGDRSPREVRGPAHGSSVRAHPGYFALDRDDRFTHLSPEAARFLGVGPDVVGESFANAVPGADRLALPGRVRAARTEGASVRYREQVGDRRLEVLVSPSDDQVSVYLHDVTDLRGSQASRGRRSRIQQALAEVSTHFVTAADPDLDRVLKVIGSAVDASRSYIFRFRDGGRKMDNTHEWCADGVTPEIANLQDLDSDLFPWWLSSLGRGETIAVEDVSAMTEEAAAERAVLEDQGIRSVLVVPILARAGRLEGFLGFDDTRRTRTWTAADARVLKVVAEMIGGELERRRTTSALRQSEERFRQLAANIPQVFWMTSVDKNAIIYVSRTYETIWGRSCESLLENPRQWLEAIHPEDRDRVAEAIAQQVHGHYDEEYRVVRPDGTVRWVRDRGFPVRDENGVAYRVAGIAEDVTDRRRQGEELQLLASAIAHAGEGVVITDAAGTIEYVNPAFEQITGYAREEVLGENPRILKSGRHDEAFYREMWDTLLGGAPWQARFTNRRKDGVLYTQESVITPVHASDGSITHLVGVFRDVTNEMALEEQLRQSQKMEAVGRLAGGIAHDVNNVLTVIAGRAEFALDDVEGQSTVRADLEEIITAAERAHNLSRQLLAFSRQQVARPRVLDPARVVRNAEKMIRRLLGEDLDLRISVPDDPGRVTVDPTQLDQVLFNLAVNARDAMPQGGRLTVDLTHVELDGTAMRGFTESVRPGRYVRLRVSDTGVGMDAETRDRIFEPFYSTKPVGQGTGLGLSTVFGIIKQANGYIRVESEKGEGTTFEIYLPRTDRPVDRETEADGTGDTEAFGPPDLTGSETVLVVEDQPAVRAMVRRSLERAGYRVLEAENGAAALSLCRDDTVAIDLVLTDVVMPRMGGPALVEQLQALRPDVRILFMSGYAEHEVIRRGALDSAVHLLEKPFGPREIQRTVRQVLDGEPF